MDESVVQKTNRQSEIAAQYKHANGNVFIRSFRPIVFLYNITLKLYGGITLNVHVSKLDSGVVALSICTCERDDDTGNCCSFGFALQKSGASRARSASKKTIAEKNEAQAAGSQ